MLFHTHNSKYEVIENEFTGLLVSLLVNIGQILGLIWTKNGEKFYLQTNSPNDEGL